jgi:1,4-dihydroxy-2-naphthoyl-CoA hydrolase
MTQPPLDLRNPDQANQAGIGRLPGLIGLVFTHGEHGLVRARLDIRPDHLAPNGYLHAATVIAIADTACGYGAVAARPEGATGFTTIELKTNFLGTVRGGGAIACEARLVHGGRMTQVWDAEVTDEATGKPIALFRCTQMMLWPRA